MAAVAVDRVITTTVRFLVTPVIIIRELVVVIRVFALFVYHLNNKGGRYGCVCCSAA